MVPGILHIRLGPQTIEATITPAGWQCSNEIALGWLESIAPIPPTEAGEPFCLAFRRAVKEFDAEVVQEPVPDPWEGIGGKSDES